MSTEITTDAESPANLSGKPSGSAAVRSSVAGAVMLALSAVSGPAPAQSAPSAPVSASAKAQSPLLASVPTAGSPERQALEEEMFAAFGNDSSAQSKREVYGKQFSPAEQAKVLGYFQKGKAEGTEPKKLKYATYDIFSIIRTAQDIRDTAKKYQETGKLDHATNKKLTSLWDRALLAVPAAAGLFDRAELDRIDKLWNSVLDDNIAKLKTENRKLDELNAIFESIRKTL